MSDLGVKRFQVMAMSIIDCREPKLGRDAFAIILEKKKVVV